MSKKDAFFRVAGKNGNPKVWLPRPPADHKPVKATEDDLAAAREARAYHPGEKTADLGAGDNASFPTWVAWGVTNVIMTNTGSVRLTAMLQAGWGGALTWELAPAGQPGSVIHTSGQWAGAVLWLSNTSEDPNAMLHVEVW